MEKRYYTASSLEQVLRSFEKAYELDSDDFYRAHVEDDERRIASVPRHHRQIWVGFYETWKRLSGSNFAERAERELELA